MADASREILMVAGQIRETVTEEVIAWGRAVLAADADKENEVLKKAAMDQGGRVQALAMVLATRFG